MALKDLISINDLTSTEVRRIFATAADLKANPRKYSDALHGCSVALIFEKPSLRTRVSFESAAVQLGGSSLFLPAQEVGLGWRESLEDFARTMSQYVDALVLRVFKHATVTGMARAASIPVINGLSDQAHPCQAAADLMTIHECFGQVAGKTVVFVGDGNNVARSLALGCAMLGARFRLSAPAGYAFDPSFISQVVDFAPQARIETQADPARAVADADIIYTDVWTSMGQEAEREERLRKFSAYQVNASLLGKAPKHARVLHCLPAHRGEEIAGEVLDGPQSLAFEQAGNRLHVQKAILEMLLT